jgi:hypothetical protein
MLFHHRCESSIVCVPSFAFLVLFPTVNLRARGIELEFIRPSYNRRHSPATKSKWMLWTTVEEEENAAGRNL